MLSFPALAFGRDLGPYAMPRRERLTWFVDEDDFSTCTASELRRGERVGMTLVDRTGRCWTVQSVTDLGVVGPLPQRILRFLLQQSVHRIEQRTVELAAMSLGEIKERAVKLIRDNPDDWRDDERIAGEAGSPEDEEDLLAELESAVRNSPSVLEIINALYQEGFRD
jgi:hypothetical protein